MEPKRRRKNESGNDTAGDLNSRTGNVSTANSKTSAKQTTADSRPVTSQYFADTRSANAQPVVNDNEKDQDVNAYIKRSLETLIKGQNELKKELNDIKASVQFQSEEIDDIKKDTKRLNIIVKNQGDKQDSNAGKIKELQDHINKLERHSRRSNIRIIGYPEKKGEDAFQIVETILKEQFERDDIEIERAHRDGKFRKGTNRHILVKFLRYQDKVDIMTRKKNKLKYENYRIAEDLTITDLKEKKGYSQQVQYLYKKKIYFRFVAGYWRDKQGNKAKFYTDDSYGYEQYTGPIPALFRNCRHTEQRDPSSDGDQRDLGDDQSTGNKSE